MYMSNFELFKKHCLGELFADSNGDIYKLVGREKPNRIKRFLSLISPQLSKIEFAFTGQKVEDIEKFRAHLLTQIKVCQDP